MVSASVPRVRGCIFVLTDYGNSDEFAGILRSVIARQAPGAPVVDLTHGIAAFDVRAGALCLARSVPHLGPGVLLGVVDPGVATSRRAIALNLGDISRPRHLVGPDNGLLIWAAEAIGGVQAAVELDRTGSGTFDGRDLFAPVASALWNGTAMADLGPAVDPDHLVRLREPALSVGAGVIEAEVLWVDTFGNVQLSARATDATSTGLGGLVEIEAAGRLSTCERAGSFEAVPSGGIGLIVDSNGHLALVGDRSSAALTLGLRETDPVTLRRVGGTS
jgi:S-adenosyl-L-methionine hydrolase (adenosine-forming)